MTEINFQTTDLFTINEKSSDYFSKIEKTTTDLNNLKKKEQIYPLIYNYFQLKEKMSNQEDTFSLKNNDLNIEKNEILKKLDILNQKTSQYEEDESTTKKTTTELLEILKNTNSELKKYAGLNRNANNMLQENLIKKNNLNDKIQELKECKTKIKSFIEELDIKKEETIKLTFSMIQTNFTYFYSKLSTKKGFLTNENKKIHVNINDKLIDTLKMSTGQKTLIALSLIFSIQRIDPAPFYFFDEIDANLDQTSRERVAKLIFEMSRNTQFFIATFREEVLKYAHKFFGVEFKNKESVFKTIDTKSAYEYVLFDEMHGSDPNST